MYTAYKRLMCLLPPIQTEEFVKLVRDVTLIKTYRRVNVPLDVSMRVEMKLRNVLLSTL